MIATKNKYLLGIVIVSIITIIFYFYYLLAGTHELEVSIMDTLISIVVLFAVNILSIMIGITVIEDENKFIT